MKSVIKKFRVNKFGTILLKIVVVVLIITKNLLAQNPLILDQYTADPTARVFENKLFLYPSHDILAGNGKGRQGWFCMEDYHVFSSGNLIDWTDHGIIVSQDKVPWVNSEAFSMWAPDCIFRNGKYYFYFPAPAKDTIYGRGFTVGVAVSDKPYGPFIPQAEPIKGVHGIDPNVFIDIDGQAYLIWASRNFYVAKLKDNMLELASEPKIITGLPEKGLKEGPFLFKRNGTYYLTYPHVQNKTERLEYAISDSPLGPFKVSGVIMDESPTGCWTNHQSIVEFKNQWYLFYHQNDLSPNFDKNRSVRIDSLFFNDDGTIKKVIPTLRGVGITPAVSNIQVDRYSNKSETGVSVAFIDTLKKIEGWKAILDSGNTWIQYNSIDFGSSKLKAVNVRASSQKGCILELHLDKVDGPLIAEIKIPENRSWNIIKTPLANYYKRIHNLVVLIKSNKAEIDWIRFE